MLVDDIRRVQRFSRGPIFLIHDLRQAGAANTRRLLQLLAREKPKNEIVMELFYPVRDDYLRRVGAALPKWSLEITLESHLPRIRRLNRRFDCDNQAIERTIGEALASGAGRVDIFFMVGLPGQSYGDAVGCADFCRSLLEKFGATGACRSLSRRSLRSSIRAALLSRNRSVSVIVCDSVRSRSTARV
jgi:radical SAM superfamily enzyme YgiQ (UPF0313 family)